MSSLARTGFVFFPLHAILILFRLYMLVPVNGTIIPASLEYNYRTGDTHYTIWLSVGNPDAMYKFSVDFSHSNIILFHDLSRISRSYSVSGSSDVVRFSERIHRLRILLDPERSEAASSCLGCDGIVGAAPSGPLWTIWPQISFSPGAIRFGEMHPLLQRDDSGKSALFACSGLSIGSVCDIEKQSALVNGKHTKIIFSYDAMTILPYSVYRSHIEGHNIFGGGYHGGKDWRPIRIEIERLDTTAIHSDAIASLSRQGYRLQQSTQPVGNGRKEGWVMLLHGNQLVSPANVGKDRHLLVGYHDEDTLILGIEVWRNLIVMKDSVHQIMVVQSFSTSAHLSSTNVWIAFFLFFFFLKRKVDPHVLGQPLPQAMYSMALQAISAPLIVTAYGLQSTRLIMEDYQTVYIITGVSILVFLLAQFGATIGLFGIHEYMRNTVNNIGHESSLLIALWLLFLERRTDDLSTSITAAINVFLVYDMAHFIISIAIYYIHVRPGGKSITASSHSLYHLFLLIFVPLVFIWHVIATYIYFARPFLRRSLADLDSRLTDVVLVVVILFIFNAALYVSWLFVRKGIISAVNSEIRAESDEEKSKR